VNEFRVCVFHTSPTQRVAVGEAEFLHLVSGGATHAVPLAPAHCREILQWGGEAIPVVDLGQWLGAHGASEGDGDYLGIVGYQRFPDEPFRLGALRMPRPPAKATVSDHQAHTTFPSDPLWKRIALCCYEDEQGAVPVLDLARVFSRNG
jgi:hypothetical protein